MGGRLQGNYAELLMGSDAQDDETIVEDFDVPTISQTRASIDRDKRAGSSITPPLYPATFIAKLWDIVNDQKNWDVITWAEGGMAIRIIDSKQFETRVLPKYFQHNKLISFIRQLNAYGFHKTSDTAEGIDFQHQSFQRNNYGALKTIQRKKTEKKRGKQASGPVGDHDDSLEFEHHSFDNRHMTARDAAQASNMDATEFIPSNAATLNYEEESHSPRTTSPSNTSLSNIVSHRMQHLPNGSSPVDLPPIRKGGHISGTLPPIHSAIFEDAGMSPRSNPTISVQVELLKGICNEVRELKSSLHSVLLDVKKLQEQNQETQQYMVYILQEILTPSPNSDVQNFINVGSAPSSGSFRSGNSRTLTAPALPPPSALPILPSPNVHLASFVNRSHPQIPPSYMSNSSTLADDMLLSPPTSDTLLEPNPR